MASADSLHILAMGEKKISGVSTWFFLYYSSYSTSLGTNVSEQLNAKYVHPNYAYNELGK